MRFTPRMEDGIYTYLFCCIMIVILHNLLIRSAVTLISSSIAMPFCLFHPMRFRITIFNFAPRGGLTGSHGRVSATTLEIRIDANVDCYGIESQ